MWLTYFSSLSAENQANWVPCDLLICVPISCPIQGGVCGKVVNLLIRRFEDLLPNPVFFPYLFCIHNHTLHSAIHVDLEGNAGTRERQRAQRSQAAVSRGTGGTLLSCRGNGLVGKMPTAQNY